MFFILALILGLLLVAGSICYAWKMGVNDTALFLMCIGTTFILFLIFLSIGNVFQKLML